MIVSAVPTWFTDYGYRTDSASRRRWRGNNGIIRDCRMTTDTGSGQANLLDSKPSCRATFGLTVRRAC